VPLQNQDSFREVDSPDSRGAVVLGAPFLSTAPRARSPGLVTPGTVLGWHRRLWGSIIRSGLAGGIFQVEIISG
jgi:hypothetical protein